MTEKPSHILVHFSEEKNNIELLMRKDPEFLALCEDYDVCVAALQYWEQSKEPEAKTRVNEYRTLVQELEEEIRAALEPQRLD
jgi:hypothetical protein